MQYLKNSCLMKGENSLRVEITTTQFLGIVEGWRSKNKMAKWEKSGGNIETRKRTNERTNFAQLRNSRGSLNFRNKRRAGQNYFVELMVAKRGGGRKERRKKKDKRRVERRLKELWRGTGSTEKCRDFPLSAKCRTVYISLY